MEISVLSSFSWKALQGKDRLKKEHSSGVLSRDRTSGLGPWRDHSQTFLLTRSLTELLQLLNLCQTCAFCIPCRFPLTLRMKQNSPFGSQNPQRADLSPSHSPLRSASPLPSIPCFIRPLTGHFPLHLNTTHILSSIFSLLTGPSQQDIPNNP